ncbi:hypothetical protein ACHAWU_001896, partial [Discostella pseudostelligera]
LSILAVINAILLRSAYTTLAQRQASYPTWLRNVRSRQFIMSTIYVGGCAFRSILPCHHTLRRALVGCYASTGFVGRCVATIAELGAADQAGLLLREIGHATNDGVITFLSYLMVPLLVSAELFSWYACVTTNYIGSIVEESLWAMCAFLSIVALLRCYNEYVGREQRDFIHKALTLNMVYFTYMVSVDVPNYIKGHIANTTDGTSYYNLIDGLKTLINITEHKITWSYEDWRYAMCWMTLYFSIACWSSIGVVNAPRMDMGLARQKIVG